MTTERPSERVPTVGAPLSSNEITTSECRECGAEVSGLNGRYACGLCGWVNHWAEGDGELPTAQDDPDWPGHR
ncbi:hypothetical protein JHN47_39815 [Streptomyces sp. MBT62]|uniref:hypothetical protein n=1 Tax=Streptomyces sp. MBT53 TaxID=1488384 RepID=UPI001914AD6A|nr:hypothetical protein [Streptomyces sp. MBT53]MBK3569851.1 hypothetical protein [Streptomyces sp. MBT62]MBK6013269.1 hypothetical protein [Streptomyces sp. MBT53]